MTAHLLFPLADEVEDATSVQPGWIPLVLVLLLAGFIVFLFFSMRKQLNKIDIPEDEPTDDGGTHPTTQS